MQGQKIEFIASDIITVACIMAVLPKPIFIMYFYMICIVVCSIIYLLRISDTMMIRFLIIYFTALLTVIVVGEIITAVFVLRPPQHDMGVAGVVHVAHAG